GRSAIILPSITNRCLSRKESSSPRASWPRSGRCGQNVHVNPDTSHATTNIMHGMGVEVARG
ncbi:MAG: hypothetical protein AAB299_08090, partial [Thermodesulfobacteriota bacterium]